MLDNIENVTKKYIKDVLTRTVTGCLADSEKKFPDLSKFSRAKNYFLLNDFLEYYFFQNA